MKALDIEFQLRVDFAVSDRDINYFVKSKPVKINCIDWAIKELDISILFDHLAT